MKLSRAVEAGARFSGCRCSGAPVQPPVPGDFPGLVGGLIWHEQDGHPTPVILWAAILLSALTFGWGHINDKLAMPGLDWVDLSLLMAVSTIYGMIFGVLYWQLGIECTLLAHFILDAFASGVIVPAIFLITFPCRFSYWFACSQWGLLPGLS